MAEIKPEGFATLMVRNNLPSGRKVVCRVFIAEHYELNGQPMVRIVEDPELETIAQRIAEALNG